MAGVTVRKTTPEDVTEIQYIAQRGWKAAYGEFLDGETIERAMEEWYASETVREQVEREDVLHFVACENGEVVGYVGGRIADEDPARGALDTFYVDPDRWGDGIGTRLFGRELDALRERGASRVTIRVLAENEIGRSFYESHGLAVVEESEDDLFGERHPAVSYDGEI